MADRGRASTADAAQSSTAAPGRAGAPLSAAALAGLNPAQQVSAVMGALQGLAPAEVAAELDALYREGPGAVSGGPSGGVGVEGAGLRQGRRQRRGT